MPKIRDAHGQSETRTYTIWCGIKQRCLNPKNKRYSSYGGRGIDVDPRWAASFVSFIEDMGQAPTGMSIERIDNDKGYWKANCKWATDKEQKQNMRSTRFITANGKTLSMSDWARELGVHNTSLLARIKLGWSDSRVVNTPFVRRAWKQAEITCIRCSHQWTGRTERPRYCPRCGMNPFTKPHHTWRKKKKWQSGRHLVAN